jgi:hypothetical protein
MPGCPNRPSHPTVVTATICHLQVVKSLGAGRLESERPGDSVM